MNYDQYLLTKLAEEASEIAQIALKTSQFGPTERYHKMTENNMERIEAEFNDLLGIVEMINEYGSEDMLIMTDEERIAKKIAKVQVYQEYSLSLGQIDEIPEEARVERRDGGPI